jgi:hypothetical protein
MPINEVKEDIRNYAFSLCMSTNPKRIFSLIGTDAGFSRLLPDHVEVVGAELQKKVRMIQSELYPNYNIHYCNADMALIIDRGLFDFIWLDYFGNMYEDQNIGSLVLAGDKLTDDGLLCVTSNKRRTFKGDVNHDFKTGVLGYSVLDHIPYRNNGANMEFFVLKNL